MEKRLQKRQEQGNLRQLRITDEELIDFASNDYLGLARSLELQKAVMKEWKIDQSPSKGLGSTGSRLLTGNSSYAEELENAIAAFHGYEAGVLFNCGYMANVGLLSAIARENDTIYFDAQVHASTRDGIHLSRAKAFPFRHNDLDHLESRLKNSSSKGGRFICVESIYSTDGSKSPLVEVCRLAKKYQADLIVDEAHAVGLFGPLGQGLVFEHHLTDHVFAQIVTFGKALGTFGAIVLGSDCLKQVLINFATSYIYTTALPFQMLAAIKCSYDLFPKLESERVYLNQLIQQFRSTASHSSETPIQSVPIKGNLAVKKLAQELTECGFDVRPLMSPTVQRGSERLRICLHAFNTEEQVTRLLEVILTN